MNAVLIVIPAHAGIQGLLYLSFRFIVFPGHPAIRYPRLLWIPAFAGMTAVVNSERGGFFQQPLPDWIQPPLSGGLFGQPLDIAGRPENPGQDKKLETIDPLG